MTTLQRIEERVRELNLKVSHCMVGRPYDFESAAERDLLEAAAKELRAAEVQEFTLAYEG